MQTCLYQHTVFASRLQFQIGETVNKQILDLLWIFYKLVIYLLIRDNYHNFIISLNFLYSLNLFDMFKLICIDFIEFLGLISSLL